MRRLGFRRIWSAVRRKDFRYGLRRIVSFASRILLCSWRAQTRPMKCYFKMKFYFIKIITSGILFIIGARVSLCSSCMNMSRQLTFETLPSFSEKVGINQAKTLKTATLKIARKPTNSTHSLNFKLTIATTIARIAGKRTDQGCNGH